MIFCLSPALNNIVLNPSILLLLPLPIKTHPSQPVLSFQNTIHPSFPAKSRTCSRFRATTSDCTLPPPAPQSNSPYFSSVFLTVNGPPLTGSYFTPSTMAHMSLHGGKPVPIIDRDALRADKIPPANRPTPPTLRRCGQPSSSPVFYAVNLGNLFSKIILSSPIPDILSRIIIVHFLLCFAILSSCFTYVL